MQYKMKAVILAGGEGARLAPYTTILPKPLLPIGEMPILEIIIKQLSSSGFKKITIAVGHMAELIMTYFGAGNKIGIKISYSKEEVPLGTAGPLSLIKNLKETFLLMNGDILTDINYNELISYHYQQKAEVTIASYVRKVDIDFGVLECNEQGEVTNYFEKPVYSHLVSMGIYVFEPSVLAYIEPGIRMDYPDLILKLIKMEKRVARFIHKGYWLDIGRPDDYHQANQQFPSLKARFLK